MLKYQINWRVMPVAVALGAIASSALAAPGPGPMRGGFGGGGRPIMAPSAPSFHPPMNNAPVYAPSRAPVFAPPVSRAPVYTPPAVVRAPVYTPPAVVRAPVYTPPAVVRAPVYTPPVATQPAVVRGPIVNSTPSVVHPPMGNMPGYHGPTSTTPPVVSNGSYRPGSLPAMTPPMARPEARPVVGPVARPMYTPPAGTVVSRGNTSFHYGPNSAVTVYRGNQVHYTQNNVYVNNTTVIQRTYQGYGGPVVRNYMPYSWGGGPNPYVVYAYHPAYVYNPGYYQWCNTAWYQPVPYSWSWSRSEWGWNDSSWYGYYGYYYRPYPTYYAPAYWVTDWLLADMLREAYEERRELAIERASEARAYEQRVIDEEIKEQVKLQVEEAMRAHQEQQPVPVTSYLTDLRHVYAVSQGLNVTLNSSGEACSLTNGDLIRLAEVVQQGDQTANMTVVSSKVGSCAAGAVVTISITDLQEFQNDFNQRVESGMNHMKTEFHQQ